MLASTKYEVQVCNGGKERRDGGRREKGREGDRGTPAGACALILLHSITGSQPLSQQGGFQNLS